MKQRRIFTPAFMLGDWLVYPRHGFIENKDKRISLEPKLADVLVLLIEHADDVVSIDQLLERCWPRGIYGDNPVHKAIAMLRKALGDDAKSPRYIATVRKRGYRVVAPVAFDVRTHNAAKNRSTRMPDRDASNMFAMPGSGAHNDRPARFESDSVCESSQHRADGALPRSPYGRQPMRFLYRLFSETFG